MCNKILICLGGIFLKPELDLSFMKWENFCLGINFYKTSFGNNALKGSLKLWRNRLSIFILLRPFFGYCILRVCIAMLKQFGYKTQKRSYKTVFKWLYTSLLSLSHPYNLPVLVPDQYKHLFTRIVISIQIFFQTSVFLICLWTLAFPLVTIYNQTA